MFAMVSYPDMIVIMVIALLLFGPKKLPEIGRQVGTLLRDLRNMTGDVHRALDLENHNQYDSGYNSYTNHNDSHFGYTSDTAYVESATEEAKAIEPFSYSAPLSGTPVAATSTAAVVTEASGESSVSAVEATHEHGIEETSGGARVYNRPETTHNIEEGISSPVAVKDKESV